MARSNSFEGGSNGVTLTQGSGGNTGGSSGDFFNTVDTGGGVGVVAFSTAQAAHGSVSMTTSTAGVSSLAYAGYTLSSVTTDTCREYCRLVSLPSAAAQPVLRYMSGASQAYRVNVKSGGALEVRDAGNNVVGTTTSTISAGAWFRLELLTTFSATVGAITLRLYLSPDSTSISDSLTLSGLTLTATSNGLRFGIGSAMANAVQTWYDDVATEGATWHGPALRSITLSGIAVAALPGSTTVDPTLVVSPSGLAVPADLGTPTVDSGAPTSVAPSGIAVAAAPGTPAVTQTFTAAPSGLAVPVALGSLTVAQALTVVPGGLALPLALGSTSVGQNLSVTPSGVASAVAPGDPAASQPLAVAPTGVAVPVGLGLPDTTVQTQTVAPDGISVPVAPGDVVLPVSSIVLRPDTGTTPRPASGTALRPSSGAASRPSMGTVTRPFTGTVERP